jgi:dolichol-phosphate mannosyltransferase
MNVTVVLPAFNEERDLPPLLDRIGNSMSSAGVSYSILVVDDGSTDGTADIALRAAARWPVELIKHSTNRGLGAAIRTGLTAASQLDGAVVTMDADNTQDPALIPDMVAVLEQGYDVVIASRFQDGAAEIGVAPHRRMLSHAAGNIMRVLVRFKGVRDYSCGYRVYRASIIRRLLEEYGQDFIRENGFACMFELLVKLKAIRAKATEVPLVLRYDLKSGESKMCVLRTLARYWVVLRNVPKERVVAEI